MTNKTPEEERIEHEEKAAQAERDRLEKEEEERLK
jgi:hypothetical protein